MVEESRLERIRRKAREYYWINREKQLEYQKQYNKEHKEKYQDYYKGYYISHPEYFKDRSSGIKTIPPKKPKKKLNLKIKTPEPEYSEPETPEPEYSESKTPEPDKVPKQFNYDKYYSKKLLQKLQHSLPEPEPFSEFITTPQGFCLRF
tara:strand:+ start:360 stop:806 length:447 start_codon:yes stop_codon:yes gene_type:complete